jgi:hypothetical protein
VESTDRKREKESQIEDLLRVGSDEILSGETAEEEDAESNDNRESTESHDIFESLAGDAEPHREKKRAEIEAGNFPVAFQKGGWRGGNRDFAWPIPIPFLQLEQLALLSDGTRH